MRDLLEALSRRGRLCRRSLAGAGLALSAVAAFAPVQCTAQQQPYPASRPNRGIAARWDFSSAAQGFALEQISSSHDPIVGFSRPTISPVGPAVQMDGYTTLIRHPLLGPLARGGELSISCWLQLEAYPWNEVPIVDQNGPDGAIFFGVDAEGHLIASVTAKAELRKLTSVEAMPLRQWTLVTFTARDGQIALYIGGRSVVAQEAVTPAGAISKPASNQESDILIGHVRKPLLPGPPSMIHPQLPVEYSLQGSLGELTVYDHALTAEDIGALTGAGNRLLLEKTPWPAFPRAQVGAGKFGAFYTTLKFDVMWDQTRRIGPDSDVVVCFPNAAIQLVFWQGTNYVPAWVTENNRWYTDEFMEV